MSYVLRFDKRQYGSQSILTCCCRRCRSNDLLPALSIAYVLLDELRPSKRKLRKLDPVHVREVMSSISALGFCDSLLIGKGGDILDGEIRLEAARLLGLGTVSCVRVDHLSDDEQRLLRLAVNRLGEKGRWDLDELKIDFQELILTEAPIEITGFSVDEIDQIVIGGDVEALAGGDGRRPRLLRNLGRADLLILDDWGLEPLDAGARHDLLEILEERYGRRSTIVTSQLPVNRWHEIIGDPTYADAILDRIVHNAHRIELSGDSMRRTRGKQTQKA
jgi:IstB-like ATP binding protein/ParB-like nuclease domain